MATKRSLTLYLRGHEAGARAAVRTVKERAGADPQSDVGRFLSRLGREIAEDQTSLHEIMARMGVTAGRLKPAVAVVTAKLGHWTLRAYRPGEPQARLIALESLSLGIEGKAGLWRALREAASVDPRLGEFDLDTLIERAERQRRELEPYRLEAARLAAAG